MRKMKAGEYENSWEYDKAKKEERKQDRNSRDQRKGRKGVWQAKGADE